MADPEERYPQAFVSRVSRRQVLRGGLMLGVGAPVLGTFLEACGSNTGSGGGAALQLYSSTDTAQQVADAFAKQSGTKVNNYNDDAGVVLARIEAETAHPRADVYLLSDAEGMAGLAQQGRLLAYMSPQRNTMTDLALKVSDPTGLFTAVGLSGAGSFIYNTKALTAAQAPVDWPDLLKAQFKDQIAITDPAFSGPSYGAIFGILQRMGTDAGWQYITALFHNGMKVFKTNTPTLAAVEAGGRSVALAQDSAAFYDKVAKGAPLAVNYASSGTVLQGDVIAIEAKSANLSAARAFVDYVLSATGQTTEIGDAATGKGVSGDAWIIPVQPNVTQDSARVATGINWTIVDLAKAAQQEADIKAKFKTLAGAA
ncbi:MAG TPA: extracellular solute-binding protein [Candidatus Limnocylindrales bacterium]|nr:extracellular solute-binding protein [Candidatus Limnocylindrales bacterium]